MVHASFLGRNRGTTEPRNRHDAEPQDLGTTGPPNRNSRTAPFGMALKSLRFLAGRSLAGSLLCEVRIWLKRDSEVPFASWRTGRSRAGCFGRAVSGWNALPKFV